MSQRMPNDLLALVFCQLHLDEFCAAAGTCMAWHAAACKKTAWPKAVSWICLQHPETNCGRPLSKTVWAACRGISLSHAIHSDNVINFINWVEQIHKELVHVKALSVVCTVELEDNSLSDSCQAWLSRLTELRTNMQSLVQSTSRERLTHLTIAAHTNLYKDSWLPLLLTLSGLTYVRITASCDVDVLGRVLAQLADKYHALRTIEFPANAYRVKELFRGLDAGHAAHLDLSSIRTLINAPRSVSFILHALRAFPSLTSHVSNTTWLPSPPLLQLQPEPEPHEPLPTRLLSLSIDRYCTTYSAWIDPYLANLTELSVHDTAFGLSGPLPRLRLLRLPPSYDALFIDTDLAFFAPNLEQLWLFEPMMWKTYEFKRRLSPCFASLSRSQHLTHVNLQTYYPDRCAVTQEILTRTLFHFMLNSHSWHQVTCHVIPVSIHLDKSDRACASSASFASLRWHVVQECTKLGTYRPCIKTSRWRAWVPGLHTHRVVWERV
jgi:hypothetical protein